MSNKNFFYVSGILSFSFYALFFLLFILYVKSHNVKKVDAFSKATVLELDIIVDTKPKAEEKVVQTKVDNSEKSEEIVKQSTSKSLKTTADVQSLFASVSTTSQNVKKEVVTNTEKNIVASRFKSKFEKQTKSESAEVSKLLDSVKQSSSKLQVSQSSQKSDPYYSKIYEILAGKWNPRVIIDDLSAKVVITIYKDGKFEFSFLQYSGNSLFDDDLLNFLTEQTFVLFPTHDKGYKTDIEIIFKSKE
ncbi:MAG: TonB C-terminal domain-containing protein [Arcobacteraceae bacterium]